MENNMEVAMNGIEIIPVPVEKWSMKDLQTFLYEAGRYIEGDFPEIGSDLVYVSDNLSHMTKFKELQWEIDQLDREAEKLEEEVWELDQENRNLKRELQKLKGE